MQRIDYIIQIALHNIQHILKSCQIKGSDV